MESRLSTSLKRHIPALVAIAVFGFFVNLLALSGSFFMLQIYDRVIPSRSVPTLIALLSIVAIFFLAMAILDTIRGRISARIGAQLQVDLDGDVLDAAMRAPPALRRQSETAQHDLESVRRFAGSPLPAAMFDLPFAPLFFFAIFLRHPYLG
ncbi:MAG: type I secretion system permease/ATPase, partial [Deltaproteobacteria bacterium]